MLLMVVGRRCSSYLSNYSNHSTLHHYVTPHYTTPRHPTPRHPTPQFTTPHYTTPRHPTPQTNNWPVVEHLRKKVELFRSLIPVINQLDNVHFRARHWLQIQVAAVCGVVWYGVMWCGVVWCGVVWCGVVWCGVVWCGVVWCGVV